MGWREEGQARLKEKKSGKTYSMDEGDNRFRVLPNKKDPKDRPYKEFRIHRDVGPEKGMWVKCGKTVKGEGKCWLCDKQIPLLEESTDPDKRELARKMRPQEVLLLQVSPVDTNGQFLAPKPWWAPYSGGKSLGVYILQRILNVTRGAIDDPVRGRDIIVERTGQLLKTHYTGFQLVDDPTTVPKKILDQMKTLEELEPVYDPKRQLAAWRGEKWADKSEAEPTPADDDNPEDYELDNPMDDVNLGEEIPPEAEFVEGAEGVAEGEFEELPAEGGEEYDDQTAPLDDDDFAPEPEPEPAPPPRRAPPRQAPQPTRAAPPAAPARRGPAPGPTAVPRRPGTTPAPVKRAAPPAQAPRRGAPPPRPKR